MRLPHYSAVPRTFPFSNVPSRPFSNTKTLLVSLVPEPSPIFPCHSSNHRSKTRTLFSDRTTLRTEPRESRTGLSTPMSDG